MEIFWLWFQLYLISLIIVELIIRQLSLTHLPLVSHICVSEIGQYWFRWWLIAYSVPSHYLNQLWHIVNWTLGNKFQWNLNQYTIIFMQENAFDIVVCEMMAILSQPWYVNFIQLFSFFLGSKYLIENAVEVQPTDSLTLSLSGLRLTSLCHLDHMTTLTSLDLSNNSLSMLQGLGMLQCLKVLNLESNFVSSCEGLEPLKQLEELSLKNNCILTGKSTSVILMSYISWGNSFSNTLF